MTTALAVITLALLGSAVNVTQRSSCRYSWPITSTPDAEQELTDVVTDEEQAERVLRRDVLGLDGEREEEGQGHGTAVAKISSTRLERALRA